MPLILWVPVPAIVARVLSTLQIIPFALCLLVAGKATAATINFEGLADSTVVTTQYPGLTFSNTIVLTSGISLNEFEFPPHSGVNVVSDNGGAITILFSSPVTSFSGYFTYLTSFTVTAFNGASAQVSQATSAFTSNLALSGDPGSSPNEFLQVTFAGGISSVTLTGDPAGGSFVMDDASLTTATPEPSSILLLAAGLTAMRIAALASRFGDRNQVDHDPRP